MLKATVRYNRKSGFYAVQVEQVSYVAGVRRDEYYFDSAEQGIGVLVTNPAVGPQKLREREALLVKLAETAGSMMDIQVDRFEGSITFHQFAKADRRGLK